ncbi:MAG: NAD(P)/FAD-dependent oxidoreductase [Candidatus Geothermincolia bacterium]
MAEQIIVGAGLSGLVAAIILARKGYSVRILEKYKTVGAQPERWPMVDVTPMIPREMSRYLGIPIGEPQVKDCKQLNGYFWGEAFNVPIERSNLKVVERGPRGTGLDGYLLEIALGEGVKVEFEEAVLGQGAIAALPGDTIIATGLYAETFDALNIPYVMGWCFGAKGRGEREAEAAIYFGDYTNDYAYWSNINGIESVLFFTRNPIRDDELETFTRELEATEGIKVADWLYGYGPTPTAKFSNPRLFASDKILAGTISGMMEPFVLFGVHGALVSGKIAAMAVEDRAAAHREFKRQLTTWKRMLLNRKVYNRMPKGMRRHAVVSLNRVIGSTGSLGARMLGGAFHAVPGYLWQKKMQGRPLLPGEDG